MKIFGKQVKKSFFVALAAIIITLAAAFLANTGGKNDGKKMPAKQRGNTVVSVKSMVAQKDFLQDYILTNGEVESQNSVSVFSDISTGTVIHINNQFHPQFFLCMFQLLVRQVYK